MKAFNGNLAKRRMMMQKRREAQRRNAFNFISANNRNRQRSLLSR